MKNLCKMVLKLFDHDSFQENPSEEDDFFPFFIQSDDQSDKE